MSPTLLTTPLLAPLLRGVAVLVSRLLGWKLAGKFPDVPKAVIIGAPHTSNWDFLVMLMAILIWRLDVHWIGKHSLFIGPLGPVMRWLGGIPVDRSKSQSLVEQMVKHFQERDRLLLVIAPEGTRKPVERWHTGFYRIARQANVPIVLSFMDYRHKEAGVAGVEVPGDGMKEDIDRYQVFYTTKTGKNPHNYYGYKSDP
jgi:1-acyl-sn-glycerol-3-phosphate acyltransferase